MQEEKKWYLSKTVWMQVLGVVMVVVPQSQAFFQEYFVEAGTAWAAINLLHRYLTKDKLQVL